MIEISDHALKRVVKRLGVPKRAVRKLAQQAYDEGTKHSETRGSLNRYITALYFRDDHRAGEIKIHNGYVFLFDKGFLITVWLLPPRFRKLKTKLSG